MLETEFINWVV